MKRLLGSRHLPALAVAALVLLIPVLMPSNYHLRVASVVFIFALAATGLNLLLGLAGQVSLGHAGFMGVGAYAVAIGPTHLGVPPLPAAFAGIAVSCLLAYLMGRPILRLKGYYLAVATLGCGVLISLILTNEAGWTGGPDGMGVPRLVLFGMTVRGVPTWYYICGAMLVVGILLAVNLRESPTGRALRAIKDSEIAARVTGIDVSRKKLLVFVVSAAYASVAGSLLAFVNGHITPDGTSGFLRSIELVTMVVLGGTASVLGPLAGAAILVVLPQALTVFHDYEHMILGLIMMACMIAMRRGLVPTIAMRFRERTA